MKSFFTTFGWGLLYIILLPFILLILILYGIYLLIKNCFYIFYINNKEYNEKLKIAEKRADVILSNNKYVEETPSNQNETLPTNSIEEDKKVVYQTTNNIYISTSDYEKMKQNNQNLVNNETINIENNEVKEVSYQNEEPKKVEVKEDGTIDLSYLKRGE